MDCCETKGQASDTNRSPVDPVCGMAVDAPDPELVATFNGNTYYFCATVCMARFKRHPEQYLIRDQAPCTKKKGMWQRYLARLNKTTGGKSMSCH